MKTLFFGMATLVGLVPAYGQRLEWGETSSEIRSNYLQSSYVAADVGQPDGSLALAHSDVSESATTTPYDAAAIGRIDSLEEYVKSQKEKESEKKKKDAQKPTVKIGGRIHLDTAGFNQNDESRSCFNAKNSTGVRRARIGVSGNYLEQFNYKLEADFASGGSVNMKDVYIETVKLPILSDIKAGHFKECYSLDNITSSNATWFMERSNISQSICASCVGDRNLGAMIGNGSKKEDWLWNVGVFENVADSAVKYQFDKPHGYGLTLRYARLFWEDEANGGNLHLGTAYSYKVWDETSLGFFAKPEQGFAPSTLKTDSILGVDSFNAWEAELIWTYRSLGVQSEFYFLGLNDSLYNNPSVVGGYVQVGYWLTGEHYNYEKGRGSLGAVKPNCPFARRCEDGRFLRSPGAWQLAYRFSWTDFSDLPGKMSGVLYDHTIGLNWQLGAHSRLMFNYILSNNDYQNLIPKTNGLVNTVAGRLQIDF